MARGQPHSAETKAAAVSALLAGQSVSAVAATYRLSRNTVKAWRHALDLDASPPVDQEKRAELGDLIADYLREVLTTLSVQARAFRETAWLRDQSASEAAVLHGVLTDKAVRILSALEHDGGEESEGAV